jgi:hypothetical protein
MRAMARTAAEAPQPPASIRSVVLRHAAALLTALALCGVEHALLRVLGASLLSAVSRQLGRAFVLLAAAVVAGTAAALVAARVWRAVVPCHVAVAWLTATVAGYVGVGLLVSLGPVGPVPSGHFGSLLLESPGLSFEESYPRRPKVAYRMNALGFREPDFQDRKAEGTLRIALIGDSFVFGSGVPIEGTLAQSLSREIRRDHPGQQTEVINLGVPGHNLASHVDLYAAAVERLSPDVVVLCLTVPGDLSRWDVQDELRDAARPSVFALGRLLLGGAGARVLWSVLLLENDYTPAGIAHLERQMERLAALRRGGGPRLYIFPYATLDPKAREILRRVRDASILQPIVWKAEDLIVGDGHPTAAGNTKLAATLATVLDFDGVFREPARP